MSDNHGTHVGKAYSNLQVETLGPRKFPAALRSADFGKSLPRFSFPNSACSVPSTVVTAKRGLSAAWTWVPVPQHASWDYHMKFYVFILLKAGVVSGSFCPGPFRDSPHDTSLDVLQALWASRIEIPRTKGPSCSDLHNYPGLWDFPACETFRTKIRRSCGARL